MADAVARERYSYTPMKRKRGPFWRQPGFQWHPSIIRYVIAAPPKTVKVPMWEAPGRPRAWTPGIAYGPQLEHVFTTLAETTTTADPGTGGTSLAVTTRSPFPQTAGKFYLLVQDSETSKTNREIMRVTAGWGTGAGSFTVTRAQEGTTGVAHASGSYVALVLVAKSLNTSFKRCYTPDVTYYSTATLAAAGADGTTAIQAMIDAANADGGGEVVIPAYTYSTSSLTGKSYVTLAGVGKGICGIVFSDTTNTRMISAAGTNTPSTTLTVQLDIGVRTATLTSLSSFAIGDWMMFYSSSPNRNWVTRIGAIGPGNIITLEEDSTHVFTTGATTLYKLNPVFNFVLKDLTIQSPTGNNLDCLTRRSGAVSISDFVDCEINNCEFKGIAGDIGNGIIMGQGRSGVFTNNKLDRVADGDPTPSQTCKSVEFNHVTDLLCTGNRAQRSGGSAVISLTAVGLVKVDNNIIGGMTDWGAGNANSPATTSTGSQALPPAGSTFNVTSTTNFAASGTFYVAGAAGAVWGISYTGVTGTSFTGCSATGSGTIAAGSRVTQTGIPTDNGGRGIKFVTGGCNYVSCCNNTIHDAAFDGIRFSGGLFFHISFNIIYNPHDIPIMCFQDSSDGNDPVSDGEVIGNIINRPSSAAGTYHALYLNLANRVGVVANNVSNITLSGIKLLDALDCKVDNNIVNTTSDIGIHATGTSTRCSFNGNTTIATTTNSISTSSSAGLNDFSNNTVDRAMSLHDTDRVDGGRTRHTASDQLLAGIGAQSVTSLLFGVKANEIWAFECTLFINNTAADTGGVKVAVLLPTSATIKAFAFGQLASTPTFTSALITASDTLTIAFGTTAATASFVQITGTVVVAGTAGSVQIRAAEGTAADDITVQSASHLVATKAA